MREERQPYGACRKVGLAPGAVLFAAMLILPAPAGMAPEAPEIGFFDWTLVGISVVVVLLPIAWVYLCRLVSPVRLSDFEMGGGGKGTTLFPAD